MTSSCFIQLLISECHCKEKNMSVQLLEILVVENKWKWLSMAQKYTSLQLYKSLRWDAWYITIFFSNNNTYLAASHAKNFSYIFSEVFKNNNFFALNRSYGNRCHLSLISRDVSDVLSCLNFNAPIRVSRRINPSKPHAITGTHYKNVSFNKISR